MKLKRAVLIGSLLWALIFFEVSILMFGFGLNEKFEFYPIHYIIAIFLVAFCSVLYFKKAKASLANGFYLGIIFVAAGIILDAIITVPLFVKDYNFFLNPWLLLGLLETIIVASLVGLLTSNKK